MEGSLSFFSFCCGGRSERRRDQTCGFGVEIPKRSDVRLVREVRSESCGDQTCFAVGDLSPEETRHYDCLLRPGTEKPRWCRISETIVYRQSIYKSGFNLDRRRRC